jgi:hypothetical protein
MRMPHLRAHHWVVIAWIMLTVAAAISVGDAAAATGVVFLLGGMLTVLSWDFARHRRRSGRGDAYGLVDFLKDTWEED